MSWAHSPRASNFSDELLLCLHNLICPFRLNPDGKDLYSKHDELIGGSRIIYIFNDIFSKSVQHLDPFDLLSDNEIRIAIKNSAGL